MKQVKIKEIPYAGESVTNSELVNWQNANPNVTIIRTEIVTEWKRQNKVLITYME